jgi:Uma2 family endonuclease
MTIVVPRATTIEEFLKLPSIDESPAWEYINGEAVQKPWEEANIACCKSV